MLGLRVYVKHVATFLRFETLNVMCDEIALVDFVCGETENPTGVSWSRLPCAALDSQNDSDELCGYRRVA